MFQGCECMYRTNHGLVVESEEDNNVMWEWANSNYVFRKCNVNSVNIHIALLKQFFGFSLWHIHPQESLLTLWATTANAFYQEFFSRSHTSTNEEIIFEIIRMSTHHILPHIRDTAIEQCASSQTYAWNLINTHLTTKYIPDQSFRFVELLFSSAKRIITYNLIYKCLCYFIIFKVQRRVRERFTQIVMCVLVWLIESENKCKSYTRTCTKVIWTRRLVIK